MTSPTIKAPKPAKLSPEIKRNLELWRSGKNAIERRDCLATVGGAQ